MTFFTYSWVPLEKGAEFCPAFEILRGTNTNLMLASERPTDQYELWESLLPSVGNGLLERGIWFTEPNHQVVIYKTELHGRWDCIRMTLFKCSVLVKGTFLYQSLAVFYSQTELSLLAIFCVWFVGFFTPSVATTMQPYQCKTPMYLSNLYGPCHHNICTVCVCVRVYVCKDKVKMGCTQLINYSHTNRKS